MNRIKFSLFIAYSVILIALVVFICRKWFAPDPVEIKTTEIKYNTVLKDTSKMQVSELQAELDCYYTGFPQLDIKKGGGNDYVLTASLCERKWQTIATIRPRDSPRNLVIAGPLITIRGTPGVWAQYYRLFGKFGLGGGVSLYQENIIAQGGLLYMW